MSNRRTLTKKEKSEALAAIYGIAPLPTEEEAADFSARLAAISLQPNSSQSEKEI